MASEPTAPVSLALRSVPRPDLRFDVVPDRGDTHARLVAKTVVVEARRRGLVNYVSLAGADFSDMDLRDLDLTGCDLTGASLSGAALSNVNLDGAKLEFANLRGATLTDCTLNDVTVDHAALSGTSFDNCSLVGARMTGTTLSGACFVGSNLRGAVLDGIGGDRLRFESCVMRKTLILRSRMDGASLTDCDLGDATLNGVQGVGLVIDCGQASDRLGRAVWQTGLKVRDLHVQNGRIAGLSASGSEWSRVLIEGSVVKDVDLRGATISGMQIYTGNVNRLSILDSPMVELVLSGSQASKLILRNSRLALRMSHCAPSEHIDLRGATGSLSIQQGIVRHLDIRDVKFDATTLRAVTLVDVETAEADLGTFDEDRVEATPHGFDRVTCVRLAHDDAMNAPSP